MKYICFYSESKRYYCIEESGKIYRGSNKQWTPDLKYFLGTLSLNYLTQSLDDAFRDSLTELVSLGTIFISIAISIYLGFKNHKKSKEKTDAELKEVFLPEARFKEYVEKGKKQFNMQLFLIYAIFMLSICGFIAFYFTHWFLPLILGAMMTFGDTLLILWVKPVKSYRFFNQMTK